MACEAFLASPNPRTLSCARCGYLGDQHGMRARNTSLERHITLLAAQAAGLPDDRGLRAFADSRAHPGGVRVDADWDIEAAEELADCANYLIWALVLDHPGYEAGRADAVSRFERRLRTLRRVIEAWHELHTDAH